MSQDYRKMSLREKLDYVKKRTAAKKVQKRN